MVGHNYLLENVVLAAGDRLLGTSFIKHLKAWRRIQHATEAEIERLQAQKLEATLRFATTQTGYYRDWARYSNLPPAEWLRQFPILTKSLIRENLSGLLTEPRERLAKVSSSGSSGEHSTVYFNKEDVSIIRAIQTMWWEWSGYRLGDSLLQTGISPQRGLIKRAKDLVTRTTYASAFDWCPERYLKLLQKKKFAYLGGYPSSLYDMARISLENDVQASFKAAFCWGDKLFDHYRDTVRKAFGCEMYESYGASEGFMIAGQKDLDYLYIMTPHVYLELLDEKGEPVPEGELGYVVVTRLDGRAMPLIRYRLGDLAIRLPRSAYPPNRELAFPLLQQVVGRDTDIVRTPSGQALVVHFFTGILEHFSEIRQFRAVQRTLQGVEIEYIPAETFKPEVLERVERQFRRKISGNFDITFKPVERISSTPSGKPQIVESHL